MNNERPYTGAYSRRFSNLAVEFGGTVDGNLNFKTVSVKWDGSKGSVTGSGNFRVSNATTPPNFGLGTASVGDTITLKATPLQGYHFVRWDGVTARNTNNPIDITMTQNIEVTAVFAADSIEPNIQVNFGPGVHINNGGNSADLPLSGSNGGNGAESPLSDGNGGNGADLPLSGGNGDSNGILDDLIDVLDLNTGEAGYPATGNNTLSRISHFVKRWWWAILIVAYIVYKERAKK